MNTQSSPNRTAATLRARNRRLISIDDEYESLDNNNNSSPRGTPLQSTASSLFPSRTASPIPSTHPSRGTSTTRPSQSTQVNGRALGDSGLSGSYATPSTFATGLWETSWSSLQGIASNLLGNDTARSSKDKSNLNLSLQRRRRPLEATHGRKIGNTSGHWGPSGNSDKHVAYGSEEDRLAQVQVKRREKLLAANGHALPDASGNYKRRISDERQRTSPQSPGHDQDALVYLHHVQSNDTLAGITIKYGCQAAVFRKANRLWPNDSVQIRKTVYLPVEACAVRGRKIPYPPSSFDLLDDTDGTASDLTPTITPTTPRPPRTQSARPPQSTESFHSSHHTSPSISISDSDDQPPPWIHESWVLLPNFPSSVEIARLPRQALGFFPPSRRKSQSYTDLSNSSTPPTLSRAPSKSPPLLPPSRLPRHDSRSSSGSYFAHSLSGPGGVGTLGREVRSPGPAQDKLNQIFAPHLHNLVAPRASFESTASNASSTTGIENVSGAIEGWVRKMAGKTANAMGTPELRGRKGGVGAGAGDLIELVDAFELDAGPGNDGGGGGGGGGGSRSNDDGGGTGGGREASEMHLSERFPPNPRGRVFEDEGRRTKRA